MKNNTNTALFAKEFEFNTKPEELYPLLNQIISIIKEQIPAAKFTAGIEGKCKLILTELSTNALKHSSVSQSIFGLVIDEHRIQLSKSDTGKPLHLPRWKKREALTWPLKEVETEKIVVYEDDRCCLFGWLDSENTVAFYTEDHPINIPPAPKDLLEHFGLMILAKSSDDFIYQFDPVTKSNIFRVNINI